MTKGTTKAGGRQSKSKEAWKPKVSHKKENKQSRNRKYIKLNYIMILVRGILKHQLFFLKKRKQKNKRGTDFF